MFQIRSVYRIVTQRIVKYMLSIEINKNMDNFKRIILHTDLERSLYWIFGTPQGRVKKKHEKYGIFHTVSIS